MNENAWNELIEEFRALGGAADNVRPGSGPFGPGLFPIDPAKPVILHVPDNLLVADTDMLLVGNALRVGPDVQVGARERIWLDRYQELFGWGGEGGAAHRRQFEDIQTLPMDLRRALLEKFRLGDWFDEPADARVAGRYIGARYFDTGTRRVMAPIADLANHGPGAGYDHGCGITLRGTFPGEILMHYSDFDPYDVFVVWGFASPEPVAFSIELAGTIGGSDLHVSREIPRARSGQRVWVPQVTSTDGRIDLGFLMIGNKRYPRLPKGIFAKLAREAGLAAQDEPFELIRHINMLHFVELLEALDGFEQPIARTLRRMAQYQLAAMSYCYGSREV